MIDTPGKQSNNRMISNYQANSNECYIKIPVQTTTQVIYKSKFNFR